MDGWDKYFLRMIVCLVLMGMKLLFLLTIVLSSSLQAGHQVYKIHKCQAGMETDGWMGQIFSQDRVWA